MRRSCTVEDAAAVAAEVRALVPAAASVAAAVREIVEAVRAAGRRGGERERAAVRRRRVGAGASPTGSPRRSTHLDPDVRAGLEVAVANVAAVAAAGARRGGGGGARAGPDGAAARAARCARAAVYAPGGRAPYPSSVVMGAVTARAAGVDEVVVAAPAHPVILAAAALCEADEVYAMGGAQAIAALAHGTESVPRVDVIVGPGNLYVQEAKRQVERPRRASTASPGPATSA